MCVRLEDHFPNTDNIKHDDNKTAANTLYFNVHIFYIYVTFNLFRMTFNCIVNVLDQLNLINEVKNIFINFKYFCCLAALKFYKWQT